MENTLTLSETLIIAFGVMNVVLAILVLYAISLVVKLMRMASKDEVENKAPQNTVSQVPMQSFGDIDEEDKLVLALAASALASNNRPNSHFHISKITRIK